MSNGQAFTFGATIGTGALIVVAFIATHGQPTRDQLQQRVCWYAVDSAKGDTLAIIKRQPECRAWLLP